MRESAEKNFIQISNFKTGDSKKIEEPSDSIYLSDSEIESIYCLDLSNNPSMEKTRDLFVIGCYTGLRFSYYNKLVPENTKKSEKGTFLSVTPQKSNERVVIPLNWMAEEILEKYKGMHPKSFTNQELNRDLKEIGKLAEINEKVSINITKGGLRGNNVHKKYELITTNTARRSFATNMYLAGIPIYLHHENNWS